MNQNDNRLTLTSMPKYQIEWLQARSEETGVPMTALVKMILADHIKAVRQQEERAQDSDPA